MKAKLKGTTGLPFEVTEVYPETYKGEPVIPFAQYFVDEEGTIYIDTILDFISDKSAPEKAVIEGWVARDKDDGLNIYLDKPMKGEEEYFGAYMHYLPEEMLPSVTFDNSPQRVKIEITLIDE